MVERESLGSYVSVLSSVFTSAPGDILWRRLLRLWTESVLYTAAGLGICFAIGVEQIGFISLFLVSASLGERINILLEENKVTIWGNLMESGRANRLTVISVLGIFAGIITVYIALAGILSPRELRTEFGFALQIARVGGDSILSRDFGSVSEIFTHNVLVFVAILFIAFFYRTYGVVLALSWNACVWGFGLTHFVTMALHAGPLHPALFTLTASAAVLPHLILEILGYLLGSLGALFLSKGVFLYGIRSEQLRSVARASAYLIVLGVGLLFVASLAESSLAPFLLSFLKPAIF